MASPEKKLHLCNTDLLLLATMTEQERRKRLQQLSRGRGYPFYRAAKALYAIALSVASLLPIPSADVLKKSVTRKCPKGRKGEIPGNQKVLEAVREYALAHGVKGVAFSHDEVTLGRAGKRTLWGPFLLEIDGKPYLPYFDEREANSLTADARALLYSINHTYIRLQDPARYGAIGLVVFQFAKLEDGARKVIAHFDSGTKFLTDEEIGFKIDAVYRTIDALEAERVAEAAKEAG